MERKAEILHEVMPIIVCRIPSSVNSPQVLWLVRISQFLAFMNSVLCFEETFILNNNNSINTQCHACHVSHAISGLQGCPSHLNI